ncbi:hypothetical protein LUZ61_001347 [Rhynchospora tenuis]|uniref:Late embryogenesis abundant protein n=1 Tax=Rhynchospora tenuis TaxID=198213 RepID=A0AAD5ZGS5_9POAL|nr:hypothetical protein LUZ61_001347 [Rhynchospora tenuis]
MSLRVLGGIGGAAWQLKPCRVARSNPVGRRFNRTTYCAVPSSGEREGEQKMEQEKEKRPLAEHGETKTHADVMTDSFGEGYSTRSDEEGFGGVYGGNDPVLNPGHNVNHPEYDKSQGSEVKEKEKARNQPHGAHST